MEHKGDRSEVILLAGDGNLAWSIAACLIQGGQAVNLWTGEKEEAVLAVSAHLSGMNVSRPAEDLLSVSKKLQGAGHCALAILITAEDLALKTEKIHQLEKKLGADAVICVNSESIGLDKLQESAERPERILGLNWVEPAHTTRFLEIIGNSAVKNGLTEQIVSLAKSIWKKDPYTVVNFGVRSVLISAMVREAFYLVEHGYASVDDIDRACRNDAGYYLPFAGNCRYMDLMGTFGYGMVMKDLNPHLSKEQQIPHFFTDILNEGGAGMRNGRGLYRYSKADEKRWKTLMEKFSYEIEEIVNKYPFSVRQDS